MYRAYTRHTVADYAEWRAIYDGLASKRSSLGVVSDAVYRNVDNGNEITLHLDFESLEEARAFVANSEMRGAMGQAGLTGQPEIWVVENA